MIFIIQDSDLKTKKGLSVLYFYQPWLIFHQGIMESITKAELEFPDVKFYGIDIKQFKGMISRFNLSSLPTILILKDEGKTVKSIVGKQGAFNIKPILADIVQKYAATSKEIFNGQEAS